MILLFCRLVNFLLVFLESFEHTNNFITHEKWTKTSVWLVFFKLKFKKFQCLIELTPAIVRFVSFKYSIRTLRTTHSI